MATSVKIFGRLPPDEWPPLPPSNTRQRTQDTTQDDRAFRGLKEGRRGDFLGVLQSGHFSRASGGGHRATARIEPVFPATRHCLFSGPSRATQTPPLPPPPRLLPSGVMRCGGGNSVIGCGDGRIADESAAVTGERPAMYSPSSVMLAVWVPSVTP